jgi:hypothetical protein
VEKKMNKGIKNVSSSVMSTKVSVAERSKAYGSGPYVATRVGSNPTRHKIFFLVAEERSSFLALSFPSRRKTKPPRKADTQRTDTSRKPQGGAAAKQKKKKVRRRNATRNFCVVKN